MLRAYANDYCPDTSWGLSQEILLDVKPIGDLKAPEGSKLDSLYAALERAIRLQKESLDRTRNLATNIEHVWVDMNQQLRSDDKIQEILDKYRQAILGSQLGVRSALLDGVNAAPDKSERMAVRMKEIAEAEAVEANDRAFSSCRRPFDAGEQKPAVEDAFATAQNTNTVRFEAKKARYFALVVMTPQGWVDNTWIAGLSMLDENGEPLDTAGWKVVSSRGGDNAKRALANEGWNAQGRLPHFLVADMSSEHGIAGIVCNGQGDRIPKDFQLYLSSDAAPELVDDSPSRNDIVDEMKLLQRIQEDIYNQLLALKGGEYEKLSAKNEAKVKKALGEEGLEQAPSVAEELEDFTDEDKQKLQELNLEKRKQAREFGEMVDDLARLPWDFADDQQVEIFKEIRQQAEDLKDLVDVAAEKAEEGAFTWNMDTMISREGKEINVPTCDAMGAGNEPGQSEATEDVARPLKIGELPTELPQRIPKLKSSLADMKEPPMSGSSMMDHSSPTGGPMGDNLDSASADGLMTNKTPNPRNKTKGRGNLGRSGQADGQMVAEKAAAVPDNETASARTAVS